MAALASAESSTVDLPDGELTLLRKGDGPPLLFLHGSHLPGVWLPFHERLAAGADVVYPVHPGFREGEPPDWLHTPADLALLYRDLLDALGLERAALAGHALGAWAAAELAILARERVSSLAVLAPLGLRVPGHPPADFLAASPERLAVLLGGEEFLPDFGDPEEFSRFYGEMGVSARLIWERRYDLRLERLLPRVDVPALVVQGADDALVPSAHGERWADLLPQARLELVPGAGHIVHAQEPERCAELVLEAAA